MIWYQTPTAPVSKTRVKARKIKPKVFVYASPGRGVSGESSN